MSSTTEKRLSIPTDWIKTMAHHKKQSGGVTMEYQCMQAIEKHVNDLWEMYPQLKPQEPTQKKPAA